MLLAQTTAGEVETIIGEVAQEFTGPAVTVMLALVAIAIPLLLLRWGIYKVRGYIYGLVGAPPSGGGSYEHYEDDDGRGYGWTHHTKAGTGVRKRETTRAGYPRSRMRSSYDDNDY